jgi:hypothetical protein
MSSAGHPIDNIALNPRRAYITTAAFNTDFFTYTVTTNPTTFVRTGTLAANVTGATALTCPANRVLRETGRRLYPDANPGVSTLMVGVYDAISGLSGLIDPNSPDFAIFNSDKANYMVDGVDPATGLMDQGAPVFTRGTITTGSSVTAGTTVTAGTGVVATTGQIRAATVTDLTYGATPNINISLGQVFRISVTGNAAFTASNPVAGAIVYLVVTSDASIRTLTGTGIVKMASVATTASKITTIVFVSDGTNLYQTGVATAA